MTAAPTPAIEQRLAALVPRVRAARVARGAAATVAAALGGVAFVLLFDAALALSAWARGLFVSVWLTGIGVLVWRWVLVPWWADIAPAEVARELQKRMPELGERLRAAVEPSAGAAPGLRAALIEDTERRARGADLAAALPLRPVWLLAGGALAAVCAAGTAAALVPGSADRLRRVALPWAKPGAPAVRVVVTSGAPVVRRGGPVTLAAYCERTGRAALPSEAVLVSRARPGAPETRAPMTADGAGFHVTLPRVDAHFEYHVEAGGTRSDWFGVFAVDAADLADGTKLEVAAPAYTRRPRHAVARFADFDALQFSQVNYTFRFTRPVAGAALELRADDGRVTPLALELSADGTGATGSCVLGTGGTLRLTLTNESDDKRLRAQYDARAAVAPDAPPVLLEARGLVPRPRLVRPGERVPVSFVARDDFAVSRAELHVSTDPTRATFERVTIPLAHTQAGTSGELAFDPVGRVAPGAPVWVRLAVYDTRAAGTEVGPQAALFPAAWSELRTDPNAPPLAEQTVRAERAAFRDALAPVRAFAHAAHKSTTALRADTAGLTALAPDHLARLSNLRDPLRARAVALADLAREFAPLPDLSALAAGAAAVAERDFGPADAHLRAAETNDPPARGAALNSARDRFAEAAKKLDQLDAANERAARAGVDRLRLLAAADALAPGTAEAARGALARLNAALADSPALGAAVAGAKGAEVRALADRAARLRDRFRELDREATAHAATARAALVGALAREQDEVSRRAADLFARVETAARLVGSAPPRAEEFHRAAALAAAGKTVEALAELERSVAALERLATAFAASAAARADARGAAAQLALWQEDVRARLGAADKPAARAALRAEQGALAGALRALELPQVPAVLAARDSALGHAASAAEALARGANADAPMKRAADALARLADVAPPVAVRVADAARALDRAKLDFDPAANAVEALVRQFERRAADSGTAQAFARQAAPHAEKVFAVSEALAALDAPGHADRKARARAAFHTALADLRDGSPLDVQASMACARREFERLKLALDGYVPPDARAAEFARALAALSAQADALGPAPTLAQLEPAARGATEALAALAALAAPEAPIFLSDARAALERAEPALRAGAPAARALLRVSAEATAALAARLAGAEPDYDRVCRLAWARRTAAERPKEQLASDEAQRLLGREADELAFTRVGPGGQVHKRRALDLYAKLRAKSDPDRYGTDLKALATVLDELAGKMADDADLTAGFVMPAAPAAPAEEYLPSAARGTDLRALAARLRALHARVSTLSADLAALLRPPAREAVDALAERQQAVARALFAAREPAAPLSYAAELDLRFGRLQTAAARATAAAGLLRAAGSPLAHEQGALAADLLALASTPGARVYECAAGGAELATEAAALATDCDRARRSLAPDDALAAPLADTAKALRECAGHAREAAQTADAAPRRAAVRALDRAARLDPGPVATGTVQGAELRAAERALRAAATDPDAHAAVREAQRALRAAAQ